jgi:hypothetical protein
MHLFSQLRVYVCHLELLNLTNLPREKLIEREMFKSCICHLEFVVASLLYPPLTRWECVVDIVPGGTEIEP